MLGKSIMVLAATLALGVQPAAAQLNRQLDATAVDQSADSSRSNAIATQTAELGSPISPSLNRRAAEASFSMPHAPLLDENTTFERDANGLNDTIAQEHLGAGKNVAFMVVGGAAVITGLFVGGDAGNLISAGGAVLGLYGLYMYVR